MNPSCLIKGIQKLAVKNSPTILVCLGVVGLVGCVFCAVKASPTSLEVWNAKEHNDICDVPLYYADSNGHMLKNHISKPEYAKLLIQDFVPIWGPTIALGLASVACFLGANHIQVKRKEMLVVAYALGEKAYDAYTKKNVETVGWKKHLEVTDGVAKDEMAKVPYNSDTVITTTFGDTRFFDAWSGRYFLSDINSVRRAENHIVKRLAEGESLTVNDFYEELGLPTIKSGTIVGWDPNDILLDVNYHPIFDEEDRPCTAITFLVGVLESKYHIL